MELNLQAVRNHNRTRKPIPSEVKVNLKTDFHFLMFENCSFINFKQKK